MGEQKHLPFPQLVGSAAGFLVTLMEPCRSDLEKNLQGYNERSNHQAEELTCFLCCKKMKPLFCVENWEISGVFQCFFLVKKTLQVPKIFSTTTLPKVQGSVPGRASNNPTGYMRVM